MIIAEPTAAEAADVIAINHRAASYAEAVSRLQIEEAVDTYAVDGVLASPTTDDAASCAVLAAMSATRLLADLVCALLTAVDATPLLALATCRAAARALWAAVSASRRSPSAS